MNLRKQLFTAFLSVAILPLVVVGIYMFVTNLSLAFDLHKQNLFNSTEIQADLVDENINRLMVRAGRFASSQAVRNSCKNSTVRDELTSQELSNEILKFTDETLDNVAIFALLNEAGEVIYSSGSNSDTVALSEGLSLLQGGDVQYVTEIPFTELYNSLLIYTPVREGGKIVGNFLTVCRTDYLLKIISSHRQMEYSNAFIYCGEHQDIVTSKQAISSALPKLNQQIKEDAQGSLLCKLDGRQTLLYYRRLSKTPWVLVSTISIEQIFSQVWSYGLFSIAALMTVLLCIIFLSRRQSRRMLRPLDQLLGAVEQFFLAGAAKFPDTDIDPKSEIGYLAEKFSGLSDEIALAQGRLRESNYLYATLLRATYEFRIVIDLKSGSIECSSGALSEHIRSMPGQNTSEQVFAFLTQESSKTDSESVLHLIVEGKLNEPREIEVCCAPEEHRKECWYRLVAVPIMQGDGIVRRVVLHFEDITEQKREEFRLIRSSQTDSLCGLLNKTAFPQHCQMSSDGNQDAMFFIDLDKFKLVNDSLGHTVGDDVLVSTAHIIRSQFQENDVVGRFGGDEFVVFSPGIGREGAKLKAERLVQAISFHLDSPQNGEINVTASVGVCVASASDLTLEQTLQLADEAMYLAKKNGRAQYYLAEPKSNHDIKV